MRNLYRAGWQLAQMGGMSGMQAKTHLLESVELDGRPIAFERGLLLRYGRADEPTWSWHVMLLCVPPQDALWIGPAWRREYALLASALDGQRLSGSVRALPFRSVPGCPRLIGVSPLLPVERPRAG